jgi:hypothetical protein
MDEPVSCLDGGSGQYDRPAHEVEALRGGALRII